MYGPEVDIWAVGCIFGELLQRKVLFHGTNELDQLHKIFDIIGMPNDSTWPGYSELPAIRHGAKIKVGGSLGSTRDVGRQIRPVDLIPY